MSEFTDLLIHIYPRQPGDPRYPVAVAVDDADPLTERLLLDLGDLAAAEQTLDAAVYGLDLFDRLFSGKVRRAYDRAVGMAQQQAGQLRVRLWIETAAVELHAVPWERLYHSYEAKAIALAATGKTPRASTPRQSSCSLRWPIRATYRPACHRSMSRRRCAACNRRCANCGVMAASRSR